MNEEHNQRLSVTVDKLLSESNDRLQTHLKERMHALDEKNVLTQELEKSRKLSEELHHEKNDIMKQLSKTRLEIENYKRQLLQQEIAFNIRQTEALTKNLSPSNDIDCNDFSTTYDTHSLRRKANTNQESQYQRTFVEQDWIKSQQIQMLNEVQQPYNLTRSLDVTDPESLFTASDILSPSGHTDAQTLALMLQEQLDAINNEIRLIQEEKQSTEARAEELESRVGSIEHMNLLVRGRTSDKLSPELSGRSSPNSPNRDFLHRFGIPTESSRDGLNTSNIQSNDSSSGGAASPLTARSLRLERFAQVLADSQEELRRYCINN
uniref:CSON007695 protein n=1 Tax=Culicoides sonorensis TaxID=179676 RepID=A0A336LAK6_CULSO